VLLYRCYYICYYDLYWQYLINYITNTMKTRYCLVSRHLRQR